MAGNPFFFSINVPTCVSEASSGRFSEAKWINAYLRQITSLRRREAVCTVSAGTELRVEDRLIQAQETCETLQERSRATWCRDGELPSTPDPGWGSFLLTSSRDLYPVWHVDPTLPWHRHVMMLQLAKTRCLLKSPQPYKGSPTKSTLIRLSLWVCP